MRIQNILQTGNPNLPLVAVSAEGEFYEARIEVVGQRGAQLEFKMVLRHIPNEEIG